MFDVNAHLMDLKGKNYLQVMWRLVWFRDEHPDWSISTELVDHDKGEHVAVFRAFICNESGVPVSSGYGSESIKDFRDYLEKAETKAVGRALAMLGYGTQFAPEMEEGERIVDSPVARPQKMVTTKEEAADFVLTFGKYQGKTLREVYNTDKQYLNFLMGSERTDPAVKQAIGVLMEAIRNAG